MAYNVLIIDDSVIIRKFLIKTFGMTSIEISNFYQAANGREGLEFLGQHKVDLVLLDINMPVMNGMEFMRTIKGEGKYTKVPVVVVSTEGSQERMTELTTLGVRSYLRKPVSPEDLAGVFNKILGG